MTTSPDSDKPGSTGRPTVAVVGAGPRGISVIERIAAAAPTAPLHIALIDDSEHGAGRIWVTDQTRELCMNTLAGAVTLFTEPGSSVGAPVVEGPTLFEWIRLLRGETDTVAEPKARLFATHPAPRGLAEDFAEELAGTVEQSHPTRALYGAYLRWCLEVALARLPENVEVTHHHARAVSVRADGAGRDEIRLSDGSRVLADAAVLAVGWQTPAPTAEEERLAAAVAGNPQLVWVRPDNPVEQDLDRVPAGEDALVRGLGMGFFDAMALLTAGRGGRFAADESARSGLRYEPSGNEPHLVVSSHRGYPYVPKSDYGSLPPRAELPRLRAVIDRLSGARRIDFTDQVWPAIVRDAFEAYHRVLARVRPDAVDLDGVLAALESVRLDRDSLITGGFVSGPAQAAGTVDAAAAARAVQAAVAGSVADDSAFDLAAWFAPLTGVTGSAAEVTAHVAARLERDLAEATEAWDSPLKAGLWAISAARKPASVLGAQGVYSAESRRETLSAFMALGQMVGSGPPLFRTRELLALIDAGVVTLLGAGPRLELVGDGADTRFSVTTKSTGKPVQARTLVDAWMHKPTVARTADPLAESIVAAGRQRPFADRDDAGDPVPTGSPEVDPVTRALVHPDGTSDPRLTLIGIPTYGQMADTTISPMPGTDPLMLQETDKAARHALETALGD